MSMMIRRHRTEKTVKESVQPKKQDKPVSEEPKPTETPIRRGRPKKEQ